MKSGSVGELKSKPAAKTKPLKTLFNLPTNNLSRKADSQDPKGGFSTDRPVTKLKTEPSRQKTEGASTERRIEGASKSIGNFSLVRDLIKAGTGENYGWVVGLRNLEPSSSRYTG